jgi:transcriptional regulator with XRE-family HTH domain
MKISGARVEQARQQAGLSRADIARAIGMSEVRAWQLCTEESSNVNNIIASVLAKKLGVSVKFLEVTH